MFTHDVAYGRISFFLKVFIYICVCVYKYITLYMSRCIYYTVYIYIYIALRVYIYITLCICIYICHMFFIHSSVDEHKNAFSIRLLWVVLPLSHEYRYPFKRHYYSCYLAVPCSMGYLSSLTRDQTHSPYNRRVGRVLITGLDHKESLKKMLLLCRSSAN